MRQEKGKIFLKRSLYDRVFYIQKLLLLLLFQNIISALESWHDFFFIESSSGTHKCENSTLQTYL